MTGPVWTLLFALIAAVATVIGGLIVTTPGRLSRHVLSHLIAFGAGFMLGASFVSMVPESLHLSSRAPLWILAGYALAHLFEHAFTSHFHFGEETHHEHLVDPAVSTSALVGLALHALFDGVSISTGFLVSPALGLMIALAVILHKVPEGVTIASVMVAAGRSRRSALASTGLLALATILGAAVMLRLDAVKGPALAISAGVAIYVAATDLIPELNQQRERRYSVSALVGIVLYFGVKWLSGALDLH